MDAGPRKLITEKVLRTMPDSPPMPSWFRDNRDFGNLEAGLIAAGFDKTETAGILGENWLRFFDDNFGPTGGGA